MRRRGTCPCGNRESRRALVVAVGSVEFFFYSVRFNLQLLVHGPTALSQDIGLHVLQPCKNCETESARRPTYADGAPLSSCSLNGAKGGLEPPRPFGHQIPNLARIPISPLSHRASITASPLF